MYLISGTGDRREGSRDTTAAAAVQAADAENPTARKRMAVVLKEQPAIDSALDEETAERLTGGLPTLSADHISRWEREREQAIAAIADRSADAVARSQQPVVAELRKIGGRIESHSAAPNSIIVSLPQRSIAQARAIDGVDSVEPAPRQKPLAASVVDGSPSWHAAGCTAAGAADSTCTGAADSADGKGGPDVAIVDTGINVFHNAWGARSPLIVTAPKRQQVYGSTNLCAPKNPAFGFWCGYGSQHANAVAAIIGSRASGHLGMAHGVDKLIDPLGANSTDDWLLGFTNNGEAPTADLPEVVNDSSGVISGNSDPYAEKVADLYTSTFGIARTGAAGNTPGQRVQSPCIAHNTLCAGGMTPNAAGRADDAVAAYTSPGPTLSGRKKPDLLAEGAADCPSAVNNHSWVANCGEGSSYASARLAAASALLAGAGITNVNAQRALLINSAFMLPSAYDTQAGAARYWTPDGGWGELALEQAHAKRDNVVTGSVNAAAGATEAPGPNSARFYRVDGLAPGDRFTLAWNRRINAPSWPAITGFAAHTPTDLDLYLFRTTGDTQNGVDNDENGACVVPKAGGGTPTPVAHCGVDGEEHNENTGPQAVAADARDNVEQVRATQSGSAIVKVDAASGIDGASGEPFALAGERPLTPLSTPGFSIAAPSLSQTLIHTGGTVTLTADIINQSSGVDLVSGLSLHGVQSWLEIPDGMSLISSSLPAGQTLAPGATRHVEYTLQANRSGAFPLRIGAYSFRFSEDFEDYSPVATVVVDDEVPATQLVTPSSWFGANTAVVNWSATDALTPITNVELQTSIDGGPFTTTYSGPDAAGAAHITAGEGQSVRARVRATDSAGNQSEFSELRSWTIDAEQPVIDLQAPPRVAYGARAQVIVRAFNVGAPVTAYARYHPSQPFVPVDGELLIIPSVARQGKPVTVEAQAIDSLNRIVRTSATIATSAQKVGLALKVVRKGKRKLLQVSTTRASTGTLIVGARCGRKRIGNRVDIERASKTLVSLRSAKGTCAVTARFVPAATYQLATAKAAKRLRF